VRLNIGENNRRSEKPTAALRRFRRVLVSGDLEDMGEVFSFSSAYDYWRDIAVSGGGAEPEREWFREMINALFASSLVRDTVSSHRIENPREKIMGPVACVVFERAGDPGCEGVATLVKEAGAWKVRTYPGVFPGELLYLMNERLRPRRERLEK